MEAREAALRAVSAQQTLVQRHEALCLLVSNQEVSVLMSHQVLLVQMLCRVSSICHESKREGDTAKSLYFADQALDVFKKV